jgi:drug/metabolite transporter (DMT)-like permease
MTAIVSVTSMLVFTPLYFIFGEPNIFHASIKDIAWQAIFQGLIISILALYTYTKTIELIGASRAALFASFVPGFAVVIAYPVLGETPSLLELVGLALVTIGMIVTLRSK